MFDQTRMQHLGKAFDIGMMSILLVLVISLLVVKQDLIVPQLQFWYAKVGVVIFGLLPLSFLLLSVLIRMIFSGYSVESLRTILQLVVFAAPSLGLLGTVLGTIDGISAFSLANGIEQLLTSVEMLMSGLSIALLSTAWGASLSIPAGMLDILLSHRQEQEVFCEIPKQIEYENI